MWALLEKEFDEWAKCGRVADFWLRDDDAVSHTPELEELLRVTGDVPLGLSVIPGQADLTLVKRISDAPSLSIFQHGWMHHNWASQGSSEYPSERAQQDVFAEISKGRQRLAELFGDRALSVFVPPWSGFDESFFVVLRRLGFRGFSSYQPRSRRSTGRVAIFNVHCEIIDWSPEPWFSCDDDYVKVVLDHLAGRRTGKYDIDEPTGILTHHLVQDAKSYDFLSQLIQSIDDHPAARWVNPFGPPRSETKTFWGWFGKPWF